MTRSVTCQIYASLLQQPVILVLQAWWCFSATVFMQDRIHQHIDRCVKQVAILLTTESPSIIFLRFGLPELQTWILLNFWLWGYPKDLVYLNSITSLSNFKDCTTYHVGSIPQYKLFPAVEHMMLRFQMVTYNYGWHIKHVLPTWNWYIGIFCTFCSCYKGIIRYLIVDFGISSCKIPESHYAILQISWNSAE